MAKVIFKLRVAYPQKLMEAFDTQSSERHSGGEQASTVCYLPEDPNVTYLILDWDSVESAKKFWTSNAAKKHLAAWNAIDAPEFLTLEEFVQE